MQPQYSRSHATPAQKIEFDPAVQSLEDLLAMAERYGAEGNLRQAEDMFWMLAEDYSDTPQSEVAREKLRALAHEFERDGSPHAARAIYERLIPSPLSDITPPIGQ